MINVQISGLVNGSMGYKSQGLTLDRAVIDIDKREFAPGITYVGFSRVRHINHCLIQSFDYARIANLRKSKGYKLRWSEEDKRRKSLARRTEKTFQSLAAGTNDTVPDDIKEFFRHLKNESVIDKEEHSDNTYV